MTEAAVKRAEEVNASVDALVAGHQDAPPPQDKADPDPYVPLYDESPPIAEVDGIVLVAGLTDDQIEDALFWHQFRNGLMLVSGEPGEGKGILTNMMGWKFKRYFPECKAILDYLPRRPFGYYRYFDQKFIVEQVDRMVKIAKGEGNNQELKVKKESLVHYTAQAKAWVSSAGEVYMRNSIWLLDEYRRYHNKRKPHHPMGILLTDIYNIRRHLQTLIVGVTVKPLELDTKTCIPHVKYHVKMRQDSKNPHVFIARIHRTKFDQASETLLNIGRPTTFPINANKPRPELGDKPAETAHLTYDPTSKYFCWYDIFNSENAVALNVPNSLRKGQ